MNAYLRSAYPQSTTDSPIAESRSENGVALFEPDGHIRPMARLEADIIRLAIHHYRGQMSEVARRLGIGRSTLYRKLEDLGIERNR